MDNSLLLHCFLAPQHELAPPALAMSECPLWPWEGTVGQTRAKCPQCPPAAGIGHSPPGGLIAWRAQHCFLEALAWGPPCPSPFTLLPFSLWLDLCRQVRGTSHPQRTSGLLDCLKSFHSCGIRGLFHVPFLECRSLHERRGLQCPEHLMCPDPMPGARGGWIHERSGALCGARPPWASIPTVPLPSWVTLGT